MQTIESLKKRIHTANDLHDLVRTMKAMAAVNIRHLEKAVISLADYQHNIELALRVVLQRNPRVAVAARKAPRKHLGVIVLGSDQGMCGQLNDQIVRFAHSALSKVSDSIEQHITLAIGARVASRLRQLGYELEATVEMPGSVAGISVAVQQLLVMLESWLARDAMDHLVVFHCQHLARANYQPKQVQLLPLDRQWLQTLEQSDWPTRQLPMFTMDSEQLFSCLVREFLFIALYRAFAESLASENASRLASMWNAERNVEQRIAELTSDFHRGRQMTITGELLDIASGFEALAGEDE
jgi:F-type H+-transporting ATPase subunit gamma